MRIPTLTNQEIQTLQADAALRLIGQHTVLLTKLNDEIGKALMEKGKADIKLQQFKNTKTSLVENMRALKVVVQGGG